MIPRMVVGIGGVVGMAGLSVWATAPGTHRAPGLVVPGQVYEVSHAGDGAVRWRLLDGTLPGGPHPVSDGIVLADRGGTVQLALVDGIEAGPVSRDTVLLTARRPDQEATADARGAESAAAEAEASALASGRRPGPVSAALAQVNVAEAALTRAEAAEARATAAAQQGALPTFEAELARLDVRVQEASLHAAKMQVESARLLPWEAEQAAADARAAAAASWAEVADARAYGPALAAPFDGILDHPGGDVLVRIASLDTRWVQVRVPERERSAWKAGQATSYTTTDGAYSSEGTIARIGTLAQSSGDVPVVWASVRLEEPAPSGATGVMKTLGDGWWP